MLPQKCMECFRLLFNHLAWIKHQFLSGIADSRKAGSLWGMMRGVEGVRKSIHHSWLAKGLGLRLRLLCWGFKGVQEEIRSEEASTLQIGSVAGFHQDNAPVHNAILVTDYLTKMGIKTVGTVQVHGNQRRLLRRGLEFHVCTINKSAYMKKVWKLI